MTQLSENRRPADSSLTNSFVLALDQGTTSSRSIIFDKSGAIVSSAQKEVPQIFPAPGWVEHDPEQIWKTQTSCAMESLKLAQLKNSDIAAIGIANQRETTVIWERATGKPVYNAIVWQDRRTADECSRLKVAGAEELVRERTGLVIDSYFSATKISWILDNIKDGRKRAEDGELAFGTVDSWLIWKLTGGEKHLTDVSNASRTLLLNIHTGTWDEELLRLFAVPPALLPTVCSSSEVYGVVSNPDAPVGVPIAGVAGDQQAALFGQACHSRGMTKNTYGTGCFMLQNTGDRVVPSKHGLLNTIAWKMGTKTEYALEGSVFMGGAIVQWLRDSLGIIRSSDEIEPLALSVPDNGGVFFVPALAGLGAPHWDQYARGLIIGLTRATTKAHIARAALEAMAFQVADLLDATNSDSGAKLKELRVDGGASLNNLLLAFQSDLLGARVVRSGISETTALGAAYLAGLAVGVWRDTHEISQHWRSGAIFEPSAERGLVQEYRDKWAEAVARSKGWERF